MKIDGEQNAVQIREKNTTYQFTSTDQREKSGVQFSLELTYIRKTISIRQLYISHDIINLYRTFYHMIVQREEYEIIVAVCLLAFT